MELRQHTLVAILLAGLIQLGCSEEPVREPEATPLISVKIGMREHISYSPLKIAEEEGYFLDEGLDVELISLGGAEMLLALPLGEVDAIGSPVFVGLFNAIDRESAIRIVADKGHVEDGCSPYTFMARTDLFAEGPLTLDRINGLKLETRDGSIWGFVTDRFLESNDLSWDDFERVEYITPSSTVAAFEGDQVDLKIAAEPNQSFLIDRDLARPWLPLNDVVPGLQFSVIVFGPRLIEREPEVGTRFMTAYLRGVRTYGEGPTARNVDIISRFSRLDPELVKKACWAPIDRDGIARIDQIQEVVEWSVEGGMLDRLLQIEEWWDPRFAEEASRELDRRGY